MALPEKDDDAFKSLWNWDDNPQDDFQSIIDNMAEDPNTWEDPYANYDPVTPEEFKDGSVWADLTYVPTNTSNPDRPRTIGAGYDARRFILTVQFRDGTLYNYYNVPANIWNQLRASSSPGKYMQRELDSWPDDDRGKVKGHSKTYYARKAKAARVSQQRRFKPISEWT